MGGTSDWEVVSSAGEMYDRDIELLGLWDLTRPSIIEFTRLARFTKTGVSY
ncbi:5041_t:CDS:2 [Gigaspora margarita]|uniref:5041_t:CDS:1 n=1 Tax=Gigaspora margarita TaxID=4874 RepID=A0ABN7UJ32_GIGMA|nr:5041_t:CDS:2 [Gigaspora margarita]